MLEAKTITVSIDRDWRELYEAFWRPEAFAQRASGLSNSAIEREGEDWKAQGPEGPIRIKFSDRNGFGVMDHWVDIGGGRIVYVPLRIAANGAGAEVSLTLFRQPDMADAKFAEDAAWVKGDLLTLKALNER